IQRESDYRRAAFAFAGLAGVAAAAARFGGLRSACARFGVSLLRLARNASIRSITWAPPLPEGAAGDTEISLPDIFFSIAVSIRFFTSSSYALGLNSS